MLIGREAALGAVERLVSGARLGRSGVLVITGEPGVGKTAVLNEVVDGAAGMGVLRAVGSASERTVPFGGLLQLLRPAMGLLSQIPGPQADALAAALAVRPGRVGDRFAIGAATLSVLCRFAEERPVLVAIDDMHLLDRPSAHAFAFAAHRLMADPIVLLGTARSDELTRVEHDLPRLPLAGLDIAAATELVAARAPHAVPAELLARLHRATAGNPLALIEFAGDLGRLERSSPERPLPAPEALAREFGERAAKLGDTARAVLLVAAAAGGELRMVSRACALLGLDPAAIAEAEQAQLVRVTEDRIEFRHPLVSSAVYGAAPPAERRRVHGAVAGALPPHDVDRRPWHLADSVLGTDDQAADLLERAATAARDRGAHAVASVAFERAAQLSPGDQDHARRQVAAAESAWLAGSRPRAIALLDNAGELTGAHRLHALALRGTIAARTGSLTQARDILRTAAAEATAPDVAVTLLADTVNVCFYLGDAASALAAAHRIEAVLPGVTNVGTRALGATAAGVGRVLANDRGLDQLRQAVDLQPGGQPEDQRHLPWLLIAPLFLRDSGSGDAIRRSVDAVRSHAAVGILPFLLFHAARDEATTDRWSRAEATYAEAVRLGREIGQTTDLAMSLAGLTWLLGRQGRRAECRSAGDEAMRLCREHDIHLGRCWLLSGLGDLELALGDPVAAAARYGELEKSLVALEIRDPDLSAGPDLVEALLATGRDSEAAGVAAGFEARAEAKGRPWARARACRAAGLLADDHGIDAPFRASLALHADTLDGYERARTQLAYGERLRRARRRIDARPLLRSALATFEQLRATPWANRAARELEATGEAVRRHGQPTTAVLTPQELQISLLLAEGRTTRAVAAALFLSPKTVEYHLRKVYTKLGVRSRAELADSLHTADI